MTADAYLERRSGRGGGGHGELGGRRQGGGRRREAAGWGRSEGGSKGKEPRHARRDRCSDIRLDLSERTCHMGQVWGGELPYGASVRLDLSERTREFGALAIVHSDEVVEDLYLPYGASMEGKGQGRTMAGRGDSVACAGRAAVHLP